MKKIFIISISVFLLWGFYSCNNKKNGGDNDLVDTTNLSQFNEADFFAKVDHSKLVEINSIIEGFISPVEMSALIKSNHIEFSKDYLIPTSYAKSYETKLKQALGFGLYSTDLGYLTMYRKNGMMVDYLLTISNLANDLKVAQFFDFNVLKKIVTANDNMDSLLFLTQNAFHQIDNYFTGANQSYLTVMIVAGAWIESQYLLTRVAKEYPDKNFKEKVGSQKEILYKLYEILKIYKGHPLFDKIITQYKKLVKAYEPVKISVVQTEGKVEYVDGNMIIYPNEETKVEISDSTLQNIIQVSEDVRNAIISIK